jgi:succinate dehydrogenase/fumarate reductase flavoprotein subunit
MRGELPTVRLQADVLVLGGGMAGAWAAIAAAAEGASVILAEKGWCGTSGVTAAAGPGHWWVAPERRHDAVEQRAVATLGLADMRWMHRILDTTWTELPTLAPYYDFGVDDRGVVQYGAPRGPEYMRALRQRVEAAGVTVLDHSPALELLRHADGAVAGARGVQRQRGRDWEVRSAGVVLATGGCAFLSRLLGSRNNTGDGHLMAAEAGVELSEMEFGNGYCIAQAGTTLTRSAVYSFGTYYDASGRELPVNTCGRTERLVDAMLAGPVTCSLHRLPADLKAIFTQISPNVLLPFVRRGIDPYTQRFEVTLHAEGTVRGTGGLRVVDDDCQTTVPGLYAAGDTASRGLVAGATSGGGAINSAWALSSGIWSGRAAARRARRAGSRSAEPAEPLGEAGMRPRATAAAAESAQPYAALVQQEMLPLHKNYCRTETQLAQSLQLLHGAWDALRQTLRGEDPRTRVRARESAALVAMARWACAAAAARPESRGLHRRTDLPTMDPHWQRSLVVGGLDQVRVRPQSKAASRAEGLAA